MTVYEDGKFRIELDRRGRVYHKNQLLFIGDTHIAISMFLRNSSNLEANLKLKRRMS